MAASSKLWLPTTARDGNITARKEPAPTKGGSKYGAWAGRNLDYLNLPGGSLLGFDLTKLQLQDFRQMRDHYQVAISLYLLSFMMHQIDWRIEGDGTKQQKDWIDQTIRDVWTELIRGFCQAHWAGFSPMVIDWANGTPAQPNRIGIERIKDLVPEDCWVNWKVEFGAQQSTGWKPRFFEYDGIIQAGPGNRWGIQSPNASGPDPIPADSTIWYSLLMENGDYYGKKLLRPAFMPWFFSILMHLFSNRYYERFGEPRPVGRADFDTEVETDDGRLLNGRDAMFEILENLRSRGVVVLPSERIPWGDGSKSDYAFDIQYLESNMGGADFERYMTRLDEEISLSLFTPLLMTRTADVGSYNLGQTHSQAYLWMLNALAGDIRTYIIRHIIKPLIKYNWGVNAPRMTFEYRTLGRDNAELLRALVMETVRTGMAKPDLNQMGEAVGLDFEAITALTQAPGANQSVVKDELGIQTPPSGAPAPKSDNRSGRPMRTTPKGLQKQIAARVRSQIEKHRVHGHGDFTPDIGYRKKVAEALGVESAELVPTYARMSRWLGEVADTDLATSEVMTYFGNLVEHELATAA